MLLMVTPIISSRININLYQMLNG